MHQLLGLLDLRNDDRPAAREHLAASARVESLSSCGPSMSLAHALLQVGEREAVLEYFEACERLWRRGASRLKVWAAEVREGLIPVFGFHGAFREARAMAHAPPCWELRRGDVVHGRLHLRTREGAWFVCTFEPTGSFMDVRRHLQADFRNLADDSHGIEKAYDRLQALRLSLHPGGGGPPVTGAVIQIDGDTACFRY